MAQEKEWTLRSETSVPPELAQEFPNPLVQQRLVSLGIQDVFTARSFIDPKILIPTPGSEIPDLEKAGNRILKAIQQQERIGVWGDFDVDGQTSTTLLVQGLRTLGANPRYHIPDRAAESHGIRIPFLEKFIEEPLDLLITCDTGISENDSIEWANSRGIDVIVTDHHTLPATLPPAFALVNPQRLDSSHRLHHLAGVGVAYKLMEHLYQLNGLEVQLESLLDLVALGTIADVALLTLENHYLAQIGLEAMRKGARPLLQEIFRLKKIDPKTINEEHLSFYVAPLMNAIGRLGNANDMVQILLSENLQEVRVFASVLDNLNERRKLLTDQIFQAVLKTIENDPSLLTQPALVLHHQEWTPGVLGIVASRLVETYYVPVILLTGNPSDTISGSGRSVGSINLIEAIRACSHHLHHCGGHAMAAGLSLSGENLNNFMRSFNAAILQQTRGIQILPKINIDGYLDLQEIDLQFVQSLALLAPFGAGNPQFTFASRNINIQNIHTFGKSGKHVRLNIELASRNNLDIVWWSGAENVLQDSNVEIAYQLQPDAYSGSNGVQLKIIAMRLEESEKDSLRHDVDRMQIMDWRNETSILPALLSENKDLLIWAEGLEEKVAGSVDRMNLHPASELYVYTCPPNLVEFAKAWKIVNPQKIYLGGNLPVTDSINRVLQITLGMVKYAISNNHGVFDLWRASARSAQRSITIKSALQYLSAMGIISYTEHPDAGISVSIPGTADDELKQISEDILRYHLRETTSFRKRYLSSDPKVLMDEIIDLFADKKK